MSSIDLVGDSYVWSKSAWSSVVDEATSPTTVSLPEYSIDSLPRQGNRWDGLVASSTMATRFVHFSR